MPYNKAKKLAYLGIDHGSTFTRAALICPTTRQGSYMVENLDWRDVSPPKHAGTGFDEFSSYGCPFEAAPPGHVGPWYQYQDTWRAEHSWRHHVSLKYGMYVVSGADEELLAQYPHTSPLTDRKDDAAFVDRVRTALVELFAVVRGRVDKVCEFQGLYFDEIALSIPDQWDIRFQEAYESIVHEAFGEDKSISFLTESEALAHYVINEAHYRIQEDDLEKILFLDFGGHSMSASLFHVSLSEGDDPEQVEKVYCETGVPSGVAGGSELWEYIVGEHTAEILRGSNPMSNESKAAFLQQFASRKKNLGCNTGQSTKINFEDPNGNRHSYALSPEFIRQSWHDAFRRPLEQAEAAISAAHQSPGLLKVVISGGSIFNIDLEKRLRQLCSVAGVTPQFTTDMARRHHTMNVATGAAHAIAKKISVAEFFGRGAAIGLQMRDARELGEPDDNMWEDCAAFLIDKQVVNEYKITITATTEMQLICDPFFIRRSKDIMKPIHSYDLLTLAQKKPGRWTFKPSLVTKDGVTYLVLQETWRADAQQRGRPKACDTTTTEFPLYVRCGNNCLLVDWDFMPAGVRARFEIETPSQWLKAVPQPQPPSLHSVVANDARPLPFRRESVGGAVTAVPPPNRAKPLPEEPRPATMFQDLTLPRVVSDIVPRKLASDNTKRSGSLPGASARKRPRVEFTTARRP